VPVPKGFANSSGVSIWSGYSTDGCQYETFSDQNKYAFTYLDLVRKGSGHFDYCRFAEYISGE
jgi:hypothetical protein